MTLSGAAAPDVYALLDTVLDLFADRGARLTTVFWFELRLLTALGLAPRLQRCVQCGADTVRALRGARFSVARGGVVCADCARTRADDDKTLAPDVLAILANWQGAQTWQAARNTRCREQQLRAVERLLGQFLAYHLDTALASRAVALRLIREGGGE
jgi:DNA repair protein RecO